MSYQNELSFLSFGLLLLMVSGDGPYPPALPTSVYGPPPVIKIVTTTSAPPTPAPVYGVPNTVPPAPPAPPASPAPVYGVPDVPTILAVAPVEVIKTSYEYVIPEQPATTTTAAPASPALVYGVPSTTLPPPTEAPASPAPVYGVPNTQPSTTLAPVETSYNYIIPPQPIIPIVVKEGPYPPAVTTFAAPSPPSEVPTGPYPPPTSAPLAPYPPAVYEEPKVPVIPIKSSYEYNLPPIFKIEPTTEESKPYPPPAPNTLPPSPAPVYGVPEVSTSAPVVPVESKYMFLIPPQPVKPVVEEKVVFLAPYPPAVPHSVYGAP